MTFNVCRCETLTMGSRDGDRLEAFEMYIWRRMQRMKWIESMNNQEVLITVKENRALVNTKEEGNWIGHIMRGNRGHSRGKKKRIGEWH